MRICIGKPSHVTSGWQVIFNGLDEYIIFNIGGMNGLIAFAFFVFIDQFHIRRFIDNKQNQNIFRIILIIVLPIIVSFIHWKLK